MSAGYRAVGWNANKRRYDAWIVVGIVLYVATFASATGALHPDSTLETALIRATGSGALLLLHVVLAIGPLCRLAPICIPLLYNRRHLGVSMFLLAAAHGAFALVQYHAFGDVNPFVSLLTADGDWTRVSDLPFQPFGAAALLVLFLMAATSHDFWLHNLTAPVWKALHMGVYAAYALLLAHVGFGVLRDESSAALPLALGAGAAALMLLHLLAARREARHDARAPRAGADGWVDACGVDEIEEGCARTVLAGGERVAVVRWEGQVAALSNACQHQNGPLGEGRVRNGCLTCPWHGYEYRTEDGTSPPPFTERVPTFRVAVRDGRVLLDPRPCPAGTRQEPARCEGEGRAPLDAGFFVGWLTGWSERRRRVVGRVVLGLLALAAATALSLAAGQGPFKPANFEFGVERSFEGVLVESPAPTLRLDVPELDRAPGTTTASRWLLCAEWKHGAQELVAGLGGRRVRATGSLVYREGQLMLELHGRPEPIGVAGVAPPAPLPLGEHELRGQIVDSKCWLGVMNPADTISHRACAVRCLSGGIPALFVVRAPYGTAVSLLLTGRDGRALNGEILDLVAEPLVVRGAVERQGALLLLRAEPGEFRRE
jgi:nitrite reductase/ring-hydroxylating ferredoxin subunit/DMSO/TMAO reductase YedYZ heme-binding membrane subunit